MHALQLQSLTLKVTIPVFCYHAAVMTVAGACPGSAGAVAAAGDGAAAAAEEPYQVFHAAHVWQGCGRQPVVGLWADQQHAGLGTNSLELVSPAIAYMSEV